MLPIFIKECCWVGPLGARHGSTVQQHQHSPSPCAVVHYYASSMNNNGAQQMSTLGDNFWSRNSGLTDQLERKLGSAQRVLERTMIGVMHRDRKEVLQIT